MKYFLVKREKMLSSGKLACLAWKGWLGELLFEKMLKVSEIWLKELSSKSLEIKNNGPWVLNSNNLPN